MPHAVLVECCHFLVEVPVAVIILPLAPTFVVLLESDFPSSKAVQYYRVWLEAASGSDESPAASAHDVVL